MKKLILTKLSIFFLVLSLSAFTSSYANCAIIDVSDYANMEIGYSWNYQQSLFSEPWTVEVDSISNKSGIEVYILQEYDFSSGFKSDQHFIQLDFSTGMYIVGGLNDYGQVTEDELYWSPPIPILLHQFTEGQPSSFLTEHSFFPGTVINGSLSITRETVSVPAGTFVDTLKATQYLEGTIFQTWWYAEDVGLVKREQENGNVWELTSVSGFELPAPVPVPGAIWLLGSGLAGLAGLRKKIKS